MRRSSVIDTLPNSIYSIITSFVGFFPPHVRNGQKYRYMVDFLNGAVTWDAEEIREWQLTKIRKIIEIAIKNVPYYKKKYKSVGINYQDIKTLEDFKNIPMISKTEIMENSAEFINDQIDKTKLRLQKTGGSTGIPLNLFEIKDQSKIELAFFNNVLNRFNCDLRDRVLILRTQKESRNQKTPFWTYYPHRRQLVISSYLISKDSVYEMVKEINKFKPRYVHALPSTASIFSNCILSEGYEIKPPPQFVLLSSENCYKAQQELISKAFSCKTIIHYGQNEKCVMAIQHKEYGKLHVNPFYGYSEILGIDNDNLDQQYSEIVGTNFYNYVMPLIRYKTGDIVSMSKVKSDFGIKGDLIYKINGRAIELVQTIDNRWICAGALLTTYDDIWQNVTKLQVEQNKKGYLLFRIIKRPEYSENDEKRIIIKINKLSNNGFRISFIYVNSITSMRNGKHKLLIQNLTIPIPSGN